MKIGTSMAIARNDPPHIAAQLVAARFDPRFIVSATEPAADAMFDEAQIVKIDWTDPALDLCWWPIDLSGQKRHAGSELGEAGQIKPEGDWGALDGENQTHGVLGAFQQDVFCGDALDVQHGETIASDACDGSQDSQRSREGGGWRQDEADQVIRPIGHPDGDIPLDILDARDAIPQVCYCHLSSPNSGSCFRETVAEGGRSARSAPGGVA